MFLLGVVVRVCHALSGDERGGLGDARLIRLFRRAVGAEAQLGSLAYVDKIYSGPCWANS
jgi:hypothetical protein